VTSQATKIYRYPGRALAGDYIRSVVGFLFSLGVLLMQPSNIAVVLIFVVIAVLFGYFGFRTVQRHVTKVAVTDTEICNAGFASHVMSWGDLKRLKLRYYGTKRQEKGSGGYMQLSLKGGGKAFTYDSGMEGFKYITWLAAKAARDNGVSVDPASAGNLLALGLDADGELPPPEA
jgi:hypothetical protein